MSKTDILSQLFFSMGTSSITAFCKDNEMFNMPFDCVIEYDPTSLGELINNIHENGDDVKMYFGSGLHDSYILCRYDFSKEIYEISFLADEKSCFMSAFHFVEYIQPILEENRESLEWVVEHSPYELTDELKRFIGYGTDLNVTITYTIKNSTSTIKSEIDAIRDIIGLDYLQKEGIIGGYKIEIS